jgi:ankyrin repeat protein
MEILIKAGECDNVQDSDGATPLSFAAAKGNNEAVINLLRNGADIYLCETEFKGWSPLHAAAAYGVLEIIECLIKFGASVNVLDSEGVTSLFYAAA